MDSIIIGTGKNDICHGHIDKSPVPASEHLVVHWIPGKVLNSFLDLDVDDKSMENGKTSKNMLAFIW